jgi:hypothetical protein
MSPAGFSYEVLTKFITINVIEEILIVIPYQSVSEILCIF